MGLDMYLEGEKYFWNAASRTEDDLPLQSLRVKLGYWRKHPNLHGFLVQAFADGNDDQREIPLYASSIQATITAIREQRLPYTEGFFFGSSDLSPDQRENDILLFERALKWLNGGDSPPPPPLERPLGNGLVMMSVEPESYANLRETRTVFYRASW